MKMKGYIETLESGKHTISDTEIINHILDGLGPENDVVVASLTTRIKSSVETLNLQDVYILHKHEMRLDKANAAWNSVVSIDSHIRIVNTANLVNSQNTTQNISGHFNEQLSQPIINATPE